MSQHKRIYIYTHFRFNLWLQIFKVAGACYSCPFGIMAPKNKAKAAPKAEPKAKKSKAALVIADDPTLAEMKASI